MKINSKKIPLKLTTLPELYTFINGDNGKLLSLVIERMAHINGRPDCANCDWETIANHFAKYFYPFGVESSHVKQINFDFYSSRNIFIGHKVISHADLDVWPTINYNTRFHSCRTYTFLEWLRNFFHEVTHLVDIDSAFSFSHFTQDDEGAAPFVIGNLAVELYKKHYSGSIV